MAQSERPSAGAGAAETPVARLNSLGVGGILMQLARDGQIIDVPCEMPPVLLLPGASLLRAKAAAALRLGTDGRPLPETQSARGHLTADNVRLAHRVCNQRDYEWRMRINAMLGKRRSLEEIAERLNAQKVPTIHGTNRWTAESVRKRSRSRWCCSLTAITDPEAEDLPHPVDAHPDHGLDGPGTKVGAARCRCPWRERGRSVSRRLRD